MPLVKDRALTILREYEQAKDELLGKAAVLTDGTAGTVDGLMLDELHGLRVSITGHIGKWPISKIKMIQQ
ncbi:PRC-barrel domain containing protein [Bradyrhizobium sp. DASA03076]|uniref:PRC-barrel domain containing protein n=1 Tax=Bradyrhizobium sp. BLXBL-03 TaxID=3395916 RepID=UPI003F706E14